MSYKTSPLTAPMLSLLALAISQAAFAAETTDSVTLPSTQIVSQDDLDAAADPQQYKAKPASTTTRLDLTARETPQGVTSVKRQQMDDFQLHSIKDVIAQTPGATVEKVETDRTYFTARGFDITNFQFDGVGMPFTSGLLDGDVDTAFYEQVDILHGANGLMSGLGNPSATVNFVRKRPTYDPHAEVSVTAGSWDKRRVDVDVSGPLTDTGNIRGRLVYYHQKSNSYLDRYSNEKNGVSATLAFDLSDSDTLTTGFEQQKNNPNGNTWGALPLTDANGNALHYSKTSSSIAQKWNYWNANEQRAWAEWEHRFDNGWKSKLTLSAMDHTEDSQLFYIYANPSSSTGYTGIPSRYTQQTKEVTGDAQLSGPFTLGGREHELTVGVNYGHSREQERSHYGADYSYSVSLDDVLAGNVSAPAWTLTGDKMKADYTTIQKSAYAAARFNLTDDLKLITGARLLDSVSSGDSYGADHDQATHGKVTPYAGLVYDLNDQYSLYASYTQIFNPQVYRDVTGAVLDPLEGKSYEMGIKGELFDKRLDVSAAVFHADQKNVANYAGYSSYSYYTAQHLKSSGIELQAQGELAPGLQVMGGYTYVYITNADDGNDRERKYVPRHSVKVAATYRLPQAPQFKVGGSASWQSKIERDSNANASQDAYGLVNLMAGYDIDEHWSTTLNLNNVFNQKYLTSLYASDQSNYGDPRNVSATVSWKF